MPLKINVGISVVIPAYKSAISLPSLLERLKAVLDKLDEHYEIIIVDDSSPDNTWLILKQLKQTLQHLKIVRLLRNSGQHNALLCGMSLATGGIVVTMDDDLQNCPEDVPLLIAALHEGYDLAIGAYAVKHHSTTRNLGGRLIDSIQKHIFGLPKSFQLTSFRAVRKVVIDQVVTMSSAFPYITAMLLCHTSRCVNVPVQHQPRLCDQSNYTVKRSILLALNLLFNYSAYPLYCVVMLSFGALCFSLLLGGWVLWTVLLHGRAVQGWASVMAEISFFNALVLLALVIHGFYLARINQQLTRSRVSFAIGEVHE